MGKLKIDLGFSLKRLDLVVKGLVNTKFLGNYKSAFKGRGLEFEAYREYNSGNDDASLIDWKASRRVNQVIVKEFTEERNIEIVFLVDVSSQMLTSSTKKLKAEFAAEFVASLGRSVLEAGDSVGLILFSNKIVKNVVPEMGMQQFYSLTHNLANVSNYGGYSDIDKAINFVYRNVNEGALVILVSDFIYGLKNQNNKILRLAARKFDFISVMVSDPVDMTLPEGVGELVVEDPYSGSELLIDPSRIGKEYSKYTREELAKIKKTMKKSGADFLFLETNKPFLKELSKFFKKREAEWR